MASHAVDLVKGHSGAAYSGQRSRDEREKLGGVLGNLCFLRTALIDLHCDFRN